MKEIRINEPGAGDWIMGRCEGVFRRGMDNAIANYRSGEIVGGFVLTQYLGSSIAIHMAGEGKRWCSRDLLWMVFHYTFKQLEVHKVLAPVPSNNPVALSEDMRAGWHLEAVIQDAISPGVHLMILGMTAERCPWLRIKPKTAYIGTNVEYQGSVG